MLTSAKDKFIRCLIDEGVLKFGKFTLKSGIISPFFLNLGNAASGKAVRLIGETFADEIEKTFPGTTHLFGPPYKGISLAAAAVMASRPDMNMFYNRKEQKGHGEKGLFVGKTPDADAKIVMVDDVMTTGGTKLEAMELIQNTFGIEIVGVLVAADRRRKSEMTTFPVPLASIVDILDIIEFLKDEDPETADMIRRFYEGETIQ